MLPEQFSATDSATLLDHAPLLIWRSGTDGHRDYFNETWLRFTGRSRDEELGEGWMQGVHPDDARRRAELFLDPLRRLVPFEVEYRLRRHDGLYRWVLERGVPVHEEDEVRGFAGACLDIHDRRRGEESREAALRMMAHELRTPLQAVKMHVEVMRRSAAAGEVCGAEMFDRLDVQIDRLGRLISDLLRTGDLNGLSLHKVRLNLAALLKRVIALRSDELRDSPGRARHRLTYRGPERADVDGECRSLEQAFHGLLDNAFKFSPRGGELEVELQADGDHHRVTIRDQGVGIPEEDLPSVGRRFFRGSNVPRRNFPGLGLGLAAARDVFERHGGGLAVASELDRGTEVTVDLPRIPSERA
ncbi:MAG TPA: PAS domain-containing sensor histidine kinase [Thermoanaerobaculia bacterium]|jgi:PAS domain S-box-containing protein